MNMRSLCKYQPSPEVYKGDNHWEHNTKLNAYYIEQTQRWRRGLNVAVEKEVQSYNRRGQ